ncbi:cache domain-containing protein [Spirulina major CS-329]|uniref:sensor histidine kinase n=1 Tax=Spirulina TaxID=1154 RepID=UPI00232BB1FF|nr:MULTISPECIES: ATP-binding protein [Spirulina]MDB9494823.1 cache domain-containing protein [Spirulina subsalsa CS-330]MDB9502924.1 cache domain-containing protein [Spirulina major CS-329]
MKLSWLRPSRWPIAVKLSTTLLAVALVPTGLITYFNIQQNFEEVEAAEYQNLTLLAQSHSDRLDQFILDQQHIVEYIAQTPHLKEYLATPTDARSTLQVAVDQTLRILQDSNSDYALVYLLNASGEAVAAPGMPEILGDSFQFRNYFQIPQTQGESYVSSLLVGTNTKQPGVFFSAPITSITGEFLGVVVLKLDGEAIWTMVDELPVNEGSDVFLIDYAGIVIAHRDRSLLYHSLAELPPKVRDDVIRDRRYAVDRIPSLGLKTLAHAMVNATQAGYVTYYFPALQQQRIAGFAPLRNQEWTLGIARTEATFLASFRQSTLRSYIALGVAGAGATVLAIVLIRSIVRPIRDLTAAVASLEQDHFTPVPDHRQDELGTLARAFNAMERRLQDSFAALSTANSTLEQRVEARTAELTATLTHLQKTQAQLIQTEKMSSLGQMVAGIAHEINNPVNFIHGNLTHADQYMADLLNLIDLYEQHYPEPHPDIAEEADSIDLEFMRSDLPQLMDSMKVGTKRIREIVLSLRNFSRLDEAEAKYVDLHESLDSTILLLKHRLQSKDHRPALGILKQYGTLPKVSCYPGPLNQVLLNIMSNGIDALKSAIADGKDFGNDSPQILLATETQDDNVIIRIRDNGTGVPEDLRAKLFDPFFTTKDVGKGTGLGLSISYQIIVDKHQGNLECESQPGKWTEFVITLPSEQITIT